MDANVAAMNEAGERRLATIREISEILPIEGADAIEVAVVDGWKVVIKKDSFLIGDLAVYFEIDSWVPNSIAPFLTRSGHFPKEYKGVQGERLRTIKLRKQLSQGLLLPTQILGPWITPTAGLDVSEQLGILKWEREMPANLRGVAKGNFPTELRKSDQERIQNCKKLLDSDDTWEITIKLDGSSMTVFIDRDDVFGVCSRNLQLKEAEDNAFWVAARKQELETAVRFLNDNFNGRYALQGELVGPGIQGNPEKLHHVEFYLYNIWDINDGSFVLPLKREEMAIAAGLLEVPYFGLLETPVSLEEVLKLADGEGMFCDRREGLVFKSFDRKNVSFKVISNEWLLAGGE